MVDTGDLKSPAARRKGSSPFSDTRIKIPYIDGCSGFFFCCYMLRSLQHIDSKGDSSPFSSGGVRKCPAAASFLGWSAGLGNSTPLSRKCLESQKNWQCLNFGRSPSSGRAKALDSRPVISLARARALARIARALADAGVIPLRAELSGKARSAGKMPWGRPGTNTPAACLRLPGPGRRGAACFTARKKNLPLNPQQPPLPELSDSA